MSAGDAAQQVGSWLVKYLALIVVYTGLVASTVTAQIQIAANTAGIERNENSIRGRVSQFIYDIDKGRLETEISDISESVDQNEEIIDEIDRGADQINSKIELEVERLRNLIEQTKTGTDAKLETILRLLEQELRDRRSSATQQ